MSLFTQKVRLSLRVEIIILLPVALVLMVLLSTFTLLSYRHAIDSFKEDLQLEAARTAGRVAELVSTSGAPSASALRRAVPHAHHIALIDTSGGVVLEIGSDAGVDPLSIFEGLELSRPVAVGPDLVKEFVAGIAPAVWNERAHYVRVDLDAVLLTRQIRSLRVLQWVVLAVNAGLTILVLLFLRHLLTPYDRLLARAREVLPDNQPKEDEVAFLISSFEKALETLRASEELSTDDIAALERTLGPSLESGLLLLGREAEVLALNPVGAGLLGIEQPATGTPLERILETHPTLLRLIQDSISIGHTIQRKEIELEEDGAAQTLGLSIHPLRRDDGSVRAYLLLFADLTETRRRADEERLATSLTQVGELAAGVAHEMRNSLATFRGYLTLVERTPEEESIRDYLLELRRETDHLERVLEDFLSFARPGSTRLEEIDVATVVRRAALDPALNGIEITLSSASEEGFPIKGDGQLLERAVRNLLRNAAEAAASSGSREPLEVDIRQTGDRVEITIADRGPGLPAELRSSLFRPFVTGRADGVGLGLSLAHRIVHLHGGRLQLEDREGGGALARISFSGTATEDQ
jgi:signal transduction histidine kinase